MNDSAKKLAGVFNLSQHEAKIYLAALDFDQATLSDIARRAKIPRTAAYPPLESLLAKGFFQSIQIGKRKYYRALDPKKLELILDQKKVILHEIAEDLTKNISSPSRDLQVSYFSGAQGIALASDILFREAKSKLGKSFENIEGTLKMSGMYGIKSSISKRISKRIKGRMIIPGKINSEFVKKLIENDEKELRKTVLVSPERYPIKASVAVFDDLVLLFTNNENPFAVLIRNKDLAVTMNSVHDMVWDRYERED
jgi:sugar-specific transcriptional regulator TrmB